MPMGHKPGFGLARSADDVDHGDLGVADHKQVVVGDALSIFQHKHVAIPQGSGCFPYPFHDGRVCGPCVEIPSRANLGLAPPTMSNKMPNWAEYPGLCRFLAQYWAPRHQVALWSLSSSASSPWSSASNRIKSTPMSTGFCCRRRAISNKTPTPLPPSSAPGWVCWCLWCPGRPRRGCPSARHTGRGAGFRVCTGQ